MDDIINSDDDDFSNQSIIAESEDTDDDIASRQLSIISDVELDDAESPLLSNSSNKVVQLEDNDELDGLDSRVIFINDEERNTRFKFASNKIRTTKYTPLTFIPKNMFEQFSRLGNFYFLVMAILQTIPMLSPLTPGAAFAPLVFVVAISAIKAAMEDAKRGKQDKKLNQSPANILRGKGWQKMAWSDIKVGHIIKIDKDCQIPADVVLISSSGHEGITFVETANLDGETNLKPRQGLLDLFEYKDSPGDLQGLVGKLECDLPNEDLYNFTGKIVLGEKTLPLSINEVLLRGCSLKNTEWATGIVVYTGRDSKVMQNANKIPIKRSSLDKKLSIIFKLVIGIMIMVCIAATIGDRVWFSYVGRSLWYFSVDEHFDPNFDSFLQFLANIILYNTMIPIALIVSMELGHFFHAKFINADLEMFDTESGKKARARNSNLSEELGQIDYVFSDKTGTLTRNEMEFFKCTIAGKSYGSGVSEIAKSRAKLLEGKTIIEPRLPSLPGADPKFSFKDPELLKDLKNSEHKDMIRESLINLAICHTVIPVVESNRGIRYEAASPDEATLVDAAKNLGFFFKARSPNSVSFDVDHEKQTYTFDVLNILEFSSKRKRMSVIVRLPDGQYRLYCKGADTVIEERMVPNQKYKEETWKHLEDYANDGLRTLLLAYRDIKKEEYESWSKKWQEAALDMHNRKERLEDVAEEIEKGLILLGGTAIEDKLQEGVPDTISALLKANIKVWVLTGDKFETAINIGYACSLLGGDMELLVVNGETLEEVEQQLKAAEFTQSKGVAETYGLVITGNALRFALQDELSAQFLKIGKECKSVICCRVSPAQKASVVKLVKEGLGIRALSIGDGANDVSMINEAGVGVGISGKEGMQAVMASDYAIAQFRFLKRLLLVHGRWSYRRISFVIVYAIYKNVVRVMSQFWFEIYSGFGAQSVYDTWTIVMWNVLFTTFPMILITALDFDVSDKASMQYPQLYTHGQKDNEFNVKRFLGWGILFAVYDSLAIFFTVYFTFAGNDGILSFAGRSLDLYDLGTTLAGITVIVSNIKLFLDIDAHHLPTHLIIWGSIVIWFGFMIFYSWSAFLLRTPELLGVVYRAFGPNFWFLVFLCTVLCLLPQYIYKSFQRQISPFDYQIIQELERDQRKVKGTKKKGIKFLRRFTFMKDVDPEHGKLGESHSHLGFAFAAGKDQESFLNKRLTSHTQLLEKKKKKKFPTKLFKRKKKNTNNKSKVIN